MSAFGKTLIAIGSYQQAGGLVTGWWDGAAGFTVAGTADVPAPSFVCWHPTLPLLYAVSEQPDGRVTALSVAEDGTLAVRGTVPSGGAEPCWVISDPIGEALLVANYDVELGHSSMTVIQLDADGLFSGDTTIVRGSGSGPVRGRQDASHVHQVVPTPYGTVLASDLGADRLVEFQIDPRGVVEVERVAMPAGSGPRHIALASDGRAAFVSGELDGTITVIRRQAGEPWAAGEQVPSSGFGASDTHSELGDSSAAEDSGADVSEAGDSRTGVSEAADSGTGVSEAADSGTGVSEAGDSESAPSQVLLVGGDRWLLVANRGPNTLAALEVSDDLRIVAEVPVAANPRYFTAIADAEIPPDGCTVLLAGQQDGVVEALRLDFESGGLESLGLVAEVPSASCVAVRPAQNLAPLAVPE
jgi:6-phosphogluconolactonase (cycloisomerase 2 family)